jgi:hypothetical protein
MKYIVNIALFFILGLSFELSGQHLSNARMIFTPRVNRFAVSGVGGGNLYEFSAENPSSSGQISVDWNIPLNLKVKSYGSREKLKTLTTVFKYNPFLRANYLSGDSSEIRKIAFVDNEFQMMLGFRYNSIRTFGQEGVAKFLMSYFADLTTAPYEIINSPTNSKGFRNFNIILGGQFGYMTNLDFGLLGVTLNPQFSYINIYDNKSGDRGFEELAGASGNLDRSYFGYGGKLVVYLNDFAVFFEGRRYYGKNSQKIISDFNDRAIFSIGGVATGTVFKNKTKEDRDN